MHQTYLASLGQHHVLHIAMGPGASRSPQLPHCLLHLRLVEDCSTQSGIRQQPMPANVGPCSSVLGAVAVSGLPVAQSCLCGAGRGYYITWRQGAHFRRLASGHK